MASLITPEDLGPFAEIPLAKAEAMIADALAMAQTVAPCITDAKFLHADAVKAILRGAILRWNAADTGAVTTQTAGPFSVQLDTTARRGGLFWPSEIEQLQKLCRTGDTDGAWGYDTVGCTPQHADVCSLNFGALYCSCGAILTNGNPLWETRQ